MLKKGEEPIPGYVLEKSLGHGAFGVVWRARAPGNTHCALKFISLDAKSGLKELKAIQRVKDIRHANLLSITAFWVLDDEGSLVSPDAVAAAVAGKPAIQGTMVPAIKPATLIIAMPLGDKNLADRLAECVQAGQPGVPVEELLEYIEESAKAIDFLNTQRHDLGDGPVAIQHCDIKPANIMITGSAAQVCDFGLARVLGGRNHSTSRGASGTPAYMAPEVIVDERPTPTTDQYSLALTYYELRTGRLPFGDVESLSQVLEAHTKGGLDFAGLSAEERAVVARGAHRNPTDRYATTLAFARALRAAVAGVGVKQQVVMAVSVAAPAQPIPMIAGTLDLPKPDVPPGSAGKGRLASTPVKDDASRSTASIRAELVETPTEPRPAPPRVRPASHAGSSRAAAGSSGMLWIVLGLAAFVMVGVVVAGAAGLYLYSADPVRPPPTAVDPYATPWGSNDPLIEREQPLIVPPPPFAPQSEIVPPPAAPPGNDDVPSN